ncbi:MAG TPA: biopolymer transporter ExbD [Methylomusa anaerophila]|uniref:Biopolymer transport protein ExbD n=1 Tax=Methylomusa anaerophila TaxID=1930071 RepID=A0A348AM32_9FIRM|nr:biopolymer transporter ExbD [Methylomusa anaerophila]BBB92130.1 biopolymer transport protein ExbD [Methylomusa anaerophila]HML87856.1 biopolymer transporter ExbD [Methylomusa anaerophila]
MKLRSLRIDGQPQLMIIPMIDIIFFLLVFFMMSTLYMVEQHTIPVNLPQASAVQQDKPRSINVTVLHDGRVMFDQEEIPLPLLQKRITAELVKQADNVFVLRADKQAEYGKVIAVLDELKLAGARRVAVATELKAR